MKKQGKYQVKHPCSSEKNTMTSPELQFKAEIFGGLISSEE